MVIFVYRPACSENVLNSTYYMGGSFTTTGAFDTTV